MSGVLTWKRLLALKCSELEEAADGWGKAGNRADAARDRLDKQVISSLTATQQGEAAKAAIARLRVMSRDFQYIYTECGLVRTTLNSFAHDLRGAQRKVLDALHEAESMKFTVHEDGSVSYPEAGADFLTKEKHPAGTAAGAAWPVFEQPPALVNPNPNTAKAQSIADRVVRAVVDAAEIDRQYIGALKALMALDGVDVTGAQWTDASSDAATVRHLAYDYLQESIPYGKSPAERQAWWFGLTQEQREEYLAVYPDQIGNLDGIPAEARDAANRDNLQLLIGKLEGRDDAKSQSQLEGLKEIDKQLLTGGNPPMYLLGIGDEGNGRAIVSYGNPDTAKNVSTYVPGLGAALDSGFAKEDLKRARDTAIGAQKYDKSSAAIVWLGYDAPQLPDSDGVVENFAVMGTGRAEQGAPAYNSFMSGLAVTNHHQDPHLTAIGHSYGSRMVGAATQRDGGIPGADDIILVGSPGVGVDRAEDLGVGKNHVFVGAAENDPVTKMPSKRHALLGTDGLYLAGPLGAYAAGDLAETDEDDRWFGRDPASEAFGARRFKVADGPRPFIDGEMGIPAHSNYFHRIKDHVSADNIARIVGGDSKKITVEKWR